MHDCLCLLAAWLPENGQRNSEEFRFFPNINYQNSRRRKKNKNHVFFIPKPISPVLSLCIWKIFIATLFPGPPLDSPNPSALKTPEAGGAAWKVPCWRMMLWSVLTTSQLLPFREPEAVREEEFQFDGIISGLYWDITLFHRGWGIPHFTSWG